MLVLLFMLIGFHILLLLQTPRDIFIFGLPGGILVIVYLAINQVQKKYRTYLIPREFIIAALYIYGVAGYFLWKASEINMLIILYVLAWWCTVCANVFIFSWYERDIDAKEGTQNISLKIGERNLLRLCNTFILLSLVIHFYNYAHFSSFLYTLGGAVVNLVMFLVINFRQSFGRKNRYALATDLALVLPGLILALSNTH